MARKGITFDQVANAAAAIKARGTEPTVAGVRIELGNEGSYSTISQHLSKWRDEAAQQVQARSLPPEVENAMMSAMMTVWNVANKLHQDEAAMLKQGYDDDRERLAGELKTAQAEIRQLEEENLSFDDQAQKQMERAVEAEKKLAATAAELEVVKKMYSELVKSIKPPSEAEPKRAGTKQERAAKTTGAPESTQA